MRLGELLLRLEIVEPAELMAALRRQVLHGGRVGTNLVEMEILSIDQLTDALARQHGLPGATHQHFTKVDSDLCAQLTADRAAQWHAIPLGRTSQGHIAVVGSDPFSSEVIAGLQECFQKAIQPVICPELRFLYWLERVFFIPRPNRFRRAPSSADADNLHPYAHHRNYARLISQCEQEQELRDPGHLARIAVKRIAVPISGESQKKLDLGDFSEGMRAIRQGRSRQAIASTVIQMCELGFDKKINAALIFGIRDGMAAGWKGFSRARPNLPAAEIAINLSDDCAISAAFQQKGTLLSRPEAPSPLDQAIWQLLGCPLDDIAIFPVLLGDDLVSLIYVQSAEEIAAEHVGALAELSRCIANSFQRLLQAAQR